MQALFKAILLMVPKWCCYPRSAGTSVLPYRLSAGLEYQTEMQKFLVLVQNPDMPAPDLTQYRTLHALQMCLIDNVTSYIKALGMF